MPWLNPRDRYGRLSVALHWIIAVLVVSLFASGLWMTGLDYYHPWYFRAPDLHQSFGILVGGLWLLRSLLRLVQSKPPPLPTQALVQHLLAKMVHVGMEFLILLVVITGYSMSTADARGVEVFGLFSLPALGRIGERGMDFAGHMHLWLAWVLIGFATVHAAAALKHHFVDRDATLRRILGLRPDNPIDKENA